MLVCLRLSVKRKVLHSGAGVILCIEKALSQVGVSAADVNYVNAHATSTPAGDLKEFQALIRCFGENTEVVVFVSFVLHSTNSIDVFCACGGRLPSVFVILHDVYHSRV